MILNRQIQQLVFTLTLMVVCTATSIQAADNAAAFLNTGRQPIAVGMGSAYVATPVGSDAIYWNPAALAHNNADFSLLQSRAFETDFLGFQASGIAETIGWGIAYDSASVTGIPESTLNNLGRYVDSGDTNSYTAQALSLALAYPLIQDLSVGLSLKAVQERAADFEATGFGADVGLQYQFDDRTVIGATLTNVIQPTLAWNTPSKNKEALPQFARLGIAYEGLHPQLMVAASGQWQDGRDAIVNVGANFALSNQIHLRAGLEDGSLTMGTGLYLGTMGIDIAWMSPKENLLSDVYRFGLRLQLDSEPNKQSVKPTQEEEK